MAHYGWRLTAFTYLAQTLQPRLWPDEVQFGLASSTTSQHHIMPSAVKVGAIARCMAHYGWLLL